MNIDGISLIFSATFEAGRGAKKNKMRWQSLMKSKKKQLTHCLKIFTNVKLSSIIEKVLSHLRFMRNEHLYRLFKTMPKGSLHHCHFDCNEDA